MNKHLLLTLLLTLTSQSLSIPYEDCRQTTILVTKISNGFDAEPEQFPWVAAIFRKNKYDCGGTLINENFVLTAAHCVPNDNTELKIVFTPCNISDTSDADRIERNVIQSYVHHDYNSSSFYSDIALLKMDEPVNYTRYLQPICLPEKSENVFNVTGTITGYGKARSNRYEDILQYAEVNSVDHFDCLKSEGAFKDLLHRESFCAGGNGTNVCKGDSGGSFIVEDRASGKWIILGVTSRGLDSADSFCNTNDYSIFVKVTNYVDWIYNIISNQKRHLFLDPVTKKAVSPENSRAIKELITKANADLDSDLFENALKRYAGARDISENSQLKEHYAKMTSFIESRILTRDGLQLMNENKFKEALDKFRRAKKLLVTRTDVWLSKYKENIAEASYKLGEMTLKKNQYKEAEKVFKEALDNTSDKKKKQLCQKKYKEVKEFNSEMPKIKKEKNSKLAIEKLIKLKNKMSSAFLKDISSEIKNRYVQWTNQMIEIEKFEVMENELTQALNTFKQDELLAKELMRLIAISKAGIFYKIGKERLLKDSFTEAISSFNKALEVDLSSVPKLLKTIQNSKANALNRNGVVNYRRGKAFEAVRSFQEAVKICSTDNSDCAIYEENQIHSDANIIYEEGEALRISKNFDEAVKKYKHALKIIPSSRTESILKFNVSLARALNSAGVHSFNKNKYKEAIRYFKEALKVPIDNETSLQTYKQNLKKVEDYVKRNSVS